MSEKHSLAAKRRLSDDPKKRSERMQSLAYMKWSKMTRKEREAHAAKMREAKI